MRSLGHAPFAGAGLFSWSLAANSPNSYMPADVTVIIPSRNRMWSLPKAIDSCRSSSLRVQIIVIDDGSADGTAEWLESQPDLEILQGEGWGKPWGVNRALSLAQGTYLR